MLLGNECCCLSADKRTAATEGFIKTLKNRKDRFYSEKDQLSINVKKYIFMTI